MSYPHARGHGPKYRLREKQELLVREAEVARDQATIEMLCAEKYAAKSVMNAYGVETAAGLSATPATREEQQFVSKALSKTMENVSGVKKEKLFKLTDLPEYLQDAILRGFMEMEREEEMRRLRV